VEMMNTVKQLYKKLKLTNTFDTVEYDTVNKVVEVTLGKDRFNMFDGDNKTFLIEYVPFDKNLLSSEMLIPNTINNKELLADCIALSQLPHRKKIHTGTERITFKYNHNAIEEVLALLLDANQDTIITECYTEVDETNKDVGIIRIEKYTVEPMDITTIPDDSKPYLFDQLLNNYRELYHEFEIRMRQQKELLKNLENLQAELEQFDEYHEIIKDNPFTF
jgi:hypothetical protein